MSNDWGHTETISGTLIDMRRVCGTDIGGACSSDCSCYSGTRYGASRHHTWINPDSHEGDLIIQLAALLSHASQTHTDMRDLLDAWFRKAGVNPRESEAEIRARLRRGLRPYTVAAVRGPGPHYEPLIATVQLGEIACGKTIACSGSYSPVLFTIDATSATEARDHAVRWLEQECHGDPSNDPRTPRELEATPLYTAVVAQVVNTTAGTGASAGTCARPATSGLLPGYADVSVVCCWICRDHVAIETAMRYQSNWVGPCCWDDRLATR
ncbi:hypothetical protein [Amycolatopsis sp. GM8]|uniref:hypothetical protein n=1 Tax=Amycolatopsis sp. GM8 TaxID=2896530 RepID=UPI001F3E0629|nr:hypothetical protein [Amycolatopsis sp. GM8]